MIIFIIVINEFLIKHNEFLDSGFLRINNSLCICSFWVKHTHCWTILFTSIHRAISDRIVRMSIHADLDLLKPHIPLLYSWRTPNTIVLCYLVTLSSHTINQQQTTLNTCRQNMENSINGSIIIE